MPNTKKATATRRKASTTAKGSPSYTWMKVPYRLTRSPLYMRLGPALQALVINLALVAADSDGRANGRLPDIIALAWHLRVDAEQLATDLYALAEVGILSIRSGVFYHIEYVRWQQPTLATERWRAWQARQESQRKKSDAGRDEASESQPSRDGAIVRSNGPFAEVEVELEGDAERESTAAVVVHKGTDLDELLIMAENYPGMVMTRALAQDIEAHPETARANLQKALASSGSIPAALLAASIRDNHRLFDPQSPKPRRAQSRNSQKAKESERRYYACPGCGRAIGHADDCETSEWEPPHPSEGKT